MDQESQKTEAPNFPTPMTFTEGQNTRWPPKYTYHTYKAVMWICHSVLVSGEMLQSMTWFLIPMKV